MLESLKRILDRLSNFDLASWLNSVTISGYKVGLDTAQKDLKEEYPSELDMEAIVRIGMRAHALSEKAIARAKGGMAHNADKLYQEMDAAMKAGMSEKEALFQIQGRLKGLFTDSYQEWELERLVRDQFLVATKEGRRAGWQNGGMKYRQWKIHLDNKTAADSKRMEGQITEIDKPYTDPLTGEKYMLAHIRPNDRCFSVGLWELPEDTIERDGLVYAKNSESDFIKGGVGSGIKGHRTEKEPPKKLPKHLALPTGIEEILYKYEYMEKLTEYQLEKFRKQILGKVKEAKKKYTKIAGYFPGDTEFERLHRKLVVDLGKLENKLESAFSAGEKKIAIDAVFQLTHVHGRYAVFEGTGENIKRALDYIRDQRIHKFSKGGTGSGIRGHTTYREEKGYLKAIKEIELFEAQVKNEPYEYGRLIDEEGNILFSTEGRNPDSIYITDQQKNILQSGKGFVFSHNHPHNTSFSIPDIYTSIRCNTKEVRIISKKYLYVMKFKRYISLKDFESRGEVYQEIYRKLFGQYNRKVLGGEITANEASIQMTHNVWENFVKMYPKDFEYTREPSKKGYGDIEKGGPGSGIKGHRTEKKYKNILSFENKIKNEKKENGLLCDKDGNILLTAEGTEDTISFSPSDRELFFNKAAGGIFTHNHPLGNSFSRADIFSSMKAKLQEVRVVGKEYTHSIKFKKEVPANIRNEFPHRYDQVFAETYTVFMHKIFNGMSDRKAQQSCFHEMIQRISKEYSEYFTYKRTTSFSKGGIGSGIRGHTTAKKEVYKKIKDFENRIRGESIESCLIVDGEGKVLISKQGTEDTIYLTENEGYTCREKAKKGKVIFTHNHPKSSSFSVEDILIANRLHLSEMRVTSKKHDYVMKISKVINEDEMMASHKGQYTHFYNKFNPWVVSGKLDKDKAWMTHTHLIWKHVAEEIDGLEYKRTR